MAFYELRFFVDRKASMRNLISFLILFKCFISYAQYPDLEYLKFSEKFLFFTSEKELPVHVYKRKELAPTIILGHSCGGVDNLFTWPDQVRDWGYNVVVPNSFSARGHTNVCHRSQIVPFDSRSDDFVRVAQWVKQQSWHKGDIGFVGFSHGAIGGLIYANSPTVPEIKAAVLYYPRCSYAGGNPKIPTQVHIGSADDWTPPSECTELKTNSDFHLYVNAYHAFDVGYGVKQMYGHTVGSNDPSVSKLAADRTKEFLQKHLK